MEVTRALLGDEPALQWAGRSVPLEGVDLELGRAWREGLGSVGSGESGPLAVRASVLNLTVVTPGLDEAAHVSGLLERLGAQHPSRTVIIVLRAEDAGETFEARVKSNLYPLPGTGRRLIFEQVTIVAGQQAVLGIPAVVDRLLNSELPNFLWWLGEPRFREPPFTKMVQLADRLIVDSACFEHLARSWRDLATVVADESGAIVSDCAWSELRPWRELVAQFFDPPALRSCLGSIARVEIVYEPHGDSGRSGRAKALLMLGWLCGRLGWRIRSTTPRVDGCCTWRLASDNGELDVTLAGEHRADGIHDLHRIVLTASGEYPGVFQVARESSTALSTAVDVAGIPSPVRLTRAIVGDDMACALQGLNQFGRDPVFDRSLLYAAELVRDAGEESE